MSFLTEQCNLQNSLNKANCSLTMGHWAWLFLPLVPKNDAFFLSDFKRPSYKNIIVCSLHYRHPNTETGPPLRGWGVLKPWHFSCHCAVFVNGAASGVWCGCVWHVCPSHTDPICWWLDTVWERVCRQRIHTQHKGPIMSPNSEEGGGLLWRRIIEACPSQTGVWWFPCLSPSPSPTNSDEVVG